MAVRIQSSAVCLLLVHASRLRSIGFLLLLRVKICLIVIGGSTVNYTVDICVRNGSFSTSRELILMMVTICRIRFRCTSRCLFTKNISIRTGLM